MPETAALVWVGAIYEATGYADEARGLLTALEARGVRAALRPVAERQLPELRAQLSPTMREALAAQESRVAAPSFVLVQHFAADGFVPTTAARVTVGRTMFETDGLPSSWVARCNALDAIWVPSRFNLETFRNAGVRVPIEVVPGGIDCAVYGPDGPRYPLPPTRGCVFLSIFEWRPRKGWDVLLRAWADAFDADADVTLVLRCSVPGRPSNPETAAWLSTTIDCFLREALGRTRASVAPIVILPELVADHALPSLYRAATAYVSPSRGEGWGRPYMEAMATGLPVIATRWSAHLDYMNDDTSLLVDIDGLVPAHDPAIPAYTGSRWAEPSHAHLVAQLRRVYEDRRAAEAIGVRARASMQAEWSWASAAQIVERAMVAIAPVLSTPAPPVTAATHPCRLRPFPSVAPVEAPSPPRLWFAMLTYNALPYTKRCVASLDRFTDEPWRLVILDNGSHDATREWLSALDDPRIDVVFSPVNRGVAGGRNDLVALLRDRVPDDGFVVFIDNDLELFPDWLKPIRDALDEWPDAGMLSSVGFEMVVHESHRELLSYPALVAMPIDVASGGFTCFVRPAVFRATGGYDEALNPFWHEDDDLTVRARAAGFVTLGVPNLAVVHHGHKSGAAAPALVQGGSLSKQRYLVAKWREAGWIGADGRVLPGRSATGALRGEIERARFDAIQLERALLTGAEDTLVRYASAPALAWLDAQTAATDVRSRVRWLPVRDRLRLIRDQRRRLSRCSERGAGRPPLCGLADAGHWHDDEWFEAAVHAAGDGRGRLQWFDRSATVWDATQVARAITAHRPSAAGGRACLIGSLRRPITWHIASLVDELVVADVLSMHGAPDGATALGDVNRFALRDVPEGRVRAVSVDVLAQFVPEANLELAVVLPWNAHGDIADIAAMLRYLHPLLTPGALVCTVVPVRLAGPPDARSLESVARLGTWLGKLGYTSLETPDSALSDEGLLAAVDPAGARIRTPDLLVIDGPRITGRLSVVARPEAITS